MRILVTGACGLLGSHLLSFLSGRHETAGIDRHPWWGDDSVQLLQGELEDLSFVRKTLRELAPELLIHCAALADVEACERDPVRASACNAGLTRGLLSCFTEGMRMLYISTDAVFSGENSFSPETEEPRPKTAYGRSKLEGEREVQRAGPNHLIVRTNFYGWSSGRKKTSAEWMHESLRTKSPVTLFEDFFFTPIYVVDLAEGLAALAGQRRQGLFHVAGKDRVSKYEFGKLLSQEAGFSMEAVQTGSRLKDLSLDSSRFRRQTGLCSPEVRPGLVRFLRDRDQPLHQRFEKACPT